MTIKTFMMRFQRYFLCGKDKREPSLNIGGPTDVRIIDVSDSLPGLTDAQRKQIREEASSGALRLQSIQPPPPLCPPLPNDSDTLPSSVFTNTELIPQHKSSGVSPGELPMAPPNTVSPKLPSSVSTSPRRKRKDRSSRTPRMKSMRSSERPCSSGSSGEDEISRSSCSEKMDPKEPKLGTDSPHTPNLDKDRHAQDTTHGAMEEASAVTERVGVRQAE